MVVRNLLSYISLIATIYILYAGFQILVSDENAQKFQGAKKTIQNFILGIIVIWLAYAIVTWIITIF